MYRIRTVPTKSKSQAVQVVVCGGHQIEVCCHLGSSKTTAGLEELKTKASAWIQDHTPHHQLPLFFPVNQEPVDLGCLVNLGVKFRLIYQMYRQLIINFHFSTKLSDIIIDLVVMRLIEPTSKRQALILLRDNFGVTYSERTMRRHLVLLSGQKTVVETAVINYAKTQLNFDCTIVFYDVTTLYFETFESNQAVKQCGFSKEHKNNQPQIVIGLVVTPDGFPLEFKLYQGNKPECKTLLPSLNSLCQRQGIKSLTVVADAAMISQGNVDDLIRAGYSYIVGARMANMGKGFITKISKALKHTDQSTARLITPKGTIVCSFSTKRYNKDKHETEKQVARAKASLTQPSQSLKRLKFLSIPRKTTPVLNRSLLEKTKLLWGIKGYFTNQNQLTNGEIVAQYHNLWKIEQNFRMAKSDLQTRPIYHYKTKTIVAHLIICFMALCVGKHIERMTGLSLKKLNYILKQIADVEIQDTKTGLISVIKKKLSTEEEEIIKKLSLAD